MDIIKQGGEYICENWIDYLGEFNVCGRIKRCPEGYFRFYPETKRPLACSDLKSLMMKVAELNQLITINDL